MGLDCNEVGLGREEGRIGRQEVGLDEEEGGWEGLGKGDIR